MGLTEACVRGGRVGPSARTKRRTGFFRGWFLGSPLAGLLGWRRSCLAWDSWGMPVVRQTSALLGPWAGVGLAA